MKGWDLGKNNRAPVILLGPLILESRIGKKIKGQLPNLVIGRVVSWNPGVYINNIYEASGMNLSIHISTYKNARVINSLITQKIQYVPCQVYIIVGIDPEGPSSVLIHQKFRHYPSEFYV
jgi:hypothetical protein